MSGTQPYIDTDPDDHDVPDRRRPTRPATCLLCGLEETTETIWLKPAWWREPGPDGKQITTVPRCREAGDCRARVEANGEPWPLLERGEEPGSWHSPVEKSLAQPTPPGPPCTIPPGQSGSNLPPEDPGPMQPSTVTEPDVPAPKEARVDWM